jgi:branched-chain amino acid transport system permease protein
MLWLNVVVQGVLLGGLYALYATGLSLVFGVMRVVNLAHGDFSVLAAYLALVMVGLSGLSPFLLTLGVVPLMFLLGFLLQRFLLAYTLSGDEMRPLLVTFGISIILQNIFQEGFSANSQGLDAGPVEYSSIMISSQLSVGWFPLVVLVAGILVITLLQLLLSHTKLGRAFRATSDDQEAAQLMGISNRRVYALAMGLSLAIVGIAGVLMGIGTTFSPTAGSMNLIFAFEAVIMGGLGSIWGTLLGGIMLGVAQTLGEQVAVGWGVLAGHLLFVVVLALRPRGLFAKTATA